MQPAEVRIRIFDKTHEKVLMVLNKEGITPGGHEKDIGWSLPGGKVRPGENLHQAAEREWLEETGLMAEIPPYYAEVTHKNSGHLVAIFEARNPVGNPNPQDRDILDVKWVDYRMISPDHTTPYGFEKSEKFNRSYPVYTSHPEYIMIPIPAVS
jgi:ADP-ribose pyrophosphatase YjhB (NUDIX family)